MSAKIRSLLFKWANPVFLSFADEHVAQWTCQKTGATMVVTTPKVDEFEFGTPIVEYFTHLGGEPLSSESEAWKAMQTTDEPLSYECPRCKGTGSTPLKAGDDCGVCGGDGVLWNETLLNQEPEGFTK